MSRGAALPDHARAAVVAVAGTEPQAAERRLLARRPPAGFILFARNCREPAQVRRLVAALRESVGAEVPVLIDQEGGRVARLRPPHWRALPAARRLGDLAAGDALAGREASRLVARLIAHDLAALGITVDCAPVLDVPAPDVHEAIGDRAFARDPALVAALGLAFMEGLEAGGVLPVIKHLPGHGRARVDSHLALPVVDAGREALEADLAPFRRCRAAPLAMTAHVLFQALDGERPATHSRRIIDEVIRGAIGFKGALLSDDINMQALSGDLGERTARARAAGCDLVVHCTGVLDEMAAVLEAAGLVEGTSRDRVETALARRRQPEPFDAQAAARRLDLLLGPSEAA